MFFGLDVEKLLIIGVFAALIIGPQKLPGLAQKLAQFVVRARGWANDAKSRIKEEMGDDFDDVEWRKLDPRQYDPRRIIRDALLEDAPATSPVVAAPAVVGVADAVPRVPTEPIGPRPATPADPALPDPTPPADSAQAADPAPSTDPVPPADPAPTDERTTPPAEVAPA